MAALVIVFDLAYQTGFGLDAAEVLLAQVDFEVWQVWCRLGLLDSLRVPTSLADVNLTCRGGILHDLSHTLEHEILETTLLAAHLSAADSRLVETPHPGKALAQPCLFLRRVFL